MASQSSLNKSDSVEPDRLNLLVNKFRVEEARYVRAYGDGLLEFEQFRDSISDVKK